MAAPRADHHLDPPAPRLHLFAGADQPARLSFEIDAVELDGAHVPVVTEDVVQLPFCALVKFARADGADLPGILVVAPLSCHFPILLRDLVLGLLGDFQVYVTDWVNARHVPAARGPFGLEHNVSYLAEFMRLLGPDCSTIALCQAGVPALMATAYISECGDDPPTRGLVLVGAPVDVSARSTRVSRLIRGRPLAWYERNAILKVPAGDAGCGRPVYPGSLQLMGLWSYLVRHMGQGGELLGKLVADDGADPQRFPFLDLYSSLMDIPAEVFVDVMRHVYHEQTLVTGAFPFGTGVVALEAVRVPLMTVEGERDDIAAPGQTYAAHELCPRIAAESRRAIVVPRCGHFSLFHGDVCRSVVIPELRRFLQ